MSFIPIDGAFPAERSQAGAGGKYGKEEKRSLKIFHLYFRFSNLKQSSGVRMCACVMCVGVKKNKLDNLEVLLIH